MPNHAEQAESATAAAQAALDQMNPDPAELAILAASHWLGAIHETLVVLAGAFAPIRADAGVYDMPPPAQWVSRQVWEDAQGARPVFDKVQGELARRLLADPPTAEQDGEPTVEQSRPDLDRHAREAALLRDDR